MGSTQTFAKRLKEARQKKSWSQTELAKAANTTATTVSKYEAGSETSKPSLELAIAFAKAGFPSTDIDKYFRIVLDEDGADWTFVCPPDYKGISDKQRRITAFYKDGFAVISDTLSELGFMVGINIPKRYRRHFDYMMNE